MVEALSDEQLIELIKDGNRQAILQLYTRHKSTVFGLCMMFLRGHKERAEDLSQEIWVRVTIYAKTFKSESKFKPWLNQIVRNTSLTELQKFKAKYKETAIEDVQVAENFNLDEFLIEESKLHSVREAVKALPDAQRVPLILHLQENLSYEEIAKATNSTVSSVKSNIFRARQNLIKCVGAA